MHSTISLLMSHRFLPMVLSGCLSVINVNIIRQSILLLVTYKVLINSDSAFYWGSILGALYFLPCFLFSVMAGELADKLPKARLFQITKATQIPICILMAITVMQEQPNIYILASTLFLMATNDAFFSPVRYAILPEYLPKDKLLMGNGILESSTLISIAAGIGMASLIGYTDHGPMIISTLLLTFSIAAYVFSLWIPKRPASDKSEFNISLNIFKSIQNSIDNLRLNQNIWQSVLGISWFWFVGYSLILQFSNYVKFNLFCTAEVALAFNISYTTGIAAGSLSCHHMMKDRLDSRLTPVALMAICIFGLHMWSGSSAFGQSPTALMPLSEFMLTLNGWRLFADVFFLSFAGGVLIVPLYSIIQRISRKEECSRNIAGLNIVSSMGMGCAAILQTMLISSLNIPFIHYMAGVFAASGILALYALKAVPLDILKLHAKKLLTWLLRIETHGLENFDHANRKLIIISNHISYFDVPLLSVFIPRHIMFAIHTEVAKWKICQLVAPLTDTFPIDPSNPYAMKSLIEKVNAGKPCVIFPEGALSRTGRIMKIYEGTALVAEKTGAQIITVNISGAKNTLLTPHRKNFAKTSLFPKIKMRFSSPFTLPEKPELSNKQKRKLYSQIIYQQLVEQSFQNASKEHLIAELYGAKNMFGSKKTIVEDITGKSLTYSDLAIKMNVLGLALGQYFKKEDHVGLLLPNTVANVVSYFACINEGAVPAMLNYTAGESNILSALKTAQIKTVITSRAFIEKASLESIVNIIDQNTNHLIYLEDLAPKITFKHKIKGAFNALTWPLRQQNNDPNKPALILFTSGSEGTPKGVVLSHKNIMANVRQLGEVVDISHNDRMFNPLPMFHAFGINVGTLTPIFNGLYTFLYPNPKHFSQIPNIIYDKEITVMMGTNTFLSAYHKTAHPYDFHHVKLAVAGGEKLTDETRKIYAEQFGIRILEGYGSTECAPVISCNTALHNKAGTVGIALPGITFDLTPFPSRENAFELSVKGDNVMLGYLLANNPGILTPPSNGWYQTGDVIEQDSRGFVQIVDRVKRFAKIGGEMISLSQVENVIQSCWPDHQHGLVTIRDEKRGEKIVLVTTNKEADKHELIKAINASGLNNLSLPSVIETMNELPLLGSGKIDYVKLKSLVDTLIEEMTVAEMN